MPTVPTQHRTTAAAGIGGSAAIVLMSLLLHFNIHLTEEEAIAWTSVITGAIGLLLKAFEAKHPEVETEIATLKADAAPYMPMIETIVRSEVARLQSQDGEAKFDPAAPISTVMGPTTIASSPGRPPDPMADAASALAVKS